MEKSSDDVWVMFFHFIDLCKHEVGIKYEIKNNVLMCFKSFSAFANNQWIYENKNMKKAKGNELRWISKKIMFDYEDIWKYIEWIIF